MKTKTLGYFYAFAATVIWAGNFVIARAVATSIPPIQVNFLRWVLAFICVVPFAVRAWRTDWPVIRKHLPYLSCLGFIGVTALNSFFYKAGQTSTSINMVLFVPTSPILILILSRIFCGEAITLRRLFGITVIFCGLLVLLSRGSLETLMNNGIHEGDLWSIGGIACFGLYTFLTRYRPQNISRFGFLAATFGLGLLYAFPMYLWEIQVTEPPIWNTPVLVGIAYAGIGCSFVAYLFWNNAIDTIGPVSAAMVYYTLPLFTSLAGAWLLGESASFMHVIGGGLMLFGIGLAIVEPKSKPG